MVPFHDTLHCYILTLLSSKVPSSVFLCMIFLMSVCPPRHWKFVKVINTLNSAIGVTSFSILISIIPLTQIPKFILTSVSPNLRTSVNSLFYFNQRHYELSSRRREINVCWVHIPEHELTIYYSFYANNKSVMYMLYMTFISYKPEAWNI